MPSLRGLHHWLWSKVANSVRTLSKISGMEDRLSHSSCTVLEARGCLSHSAVARTSPTEQSPCWGSPGALPGKPDKVEGEFWEHQAVSGLAWLALAAAGPAREPERFVGWRAWLRGKSCSIPWIWQTQSLGLPLPTWSKPFRLSGPVPVSLKSHLTQADEHC